MSFPKLRLLEHLILVDAVAPTDEVGWNPAVVDELVERSPATSEPTCGFFDGKEAVITRDLLRQDRQAGSGLIEPGFLQSSCDFEKFC